MPDYDGAFVGQIHVNTEVRGRNIYYEFWQWDGLQWEMK